MPAVTVRNIPEATHRALRLRAAKSGRSTEAEIRYILDEAVQFEDMPTDAAGQKIGLGTMIHQMAMKYGGVNLELPARNQEKPRYAVFD